MTSLDACIFNVKQKIVAAFFLVIYAEERAFLFIHSLKWCPFQDGISWYLSSTESLFFFIHLKSDDAVIARLQKQVGFSLEISCHESDITILFCVMLYLLTVNNII